MKLIVGNFKMNLLENDIEDYFDVLKKYSLNNVVLGPSNIYLKLFIDNGYIVASQDVSPFIMGAYTGDIAALQLKKIGVNYTIVGHSERRKYYNDSQYVNKKLENSLINGLIPILCIGETKEEYNRNETLDVLKKEIDQAFWGINDLNDIIIAYEPIWAIGTGLIPQNDVIYNVINFIKNYIKEKYKINIRVLYGGSVNNKNIQELENIKNIDGYLIGGCSIKVQEFCDLINKINK